MVVPTISPLAAALDGDLEPGDRFEVPLVVSAGGAGQLLLPQALRNGPFSVHVVEDEHGRPLTPLPSDGGALAAGPVSLLAQDPMATFWLEYQAPGRFRLVVGFVSSSLYAAKGCPV
jgi:hypothetical protein